jgi:hypothetical protein
MHEQTKVFLEMVARKRAEQIRKAEPELETKLDMDESGLRGALQVLRNGELQRLEFIESESTAGQVRFFNDYTEVAQSLGVLVLFFPESKFTRDMASAIYHGIMSQVRQKAKREVSFQGFVYESRGTLKKVD